MVASVQSRRFLRNEVLKRVAGLFFVLGGSFFGIMGLAWSTAAFGVISLWINSAAARELLGYTPLRQLADLKGLLIPTAAMAALVMALDSMISVAPPLKLVLLAAAGALAYFAVGLSLGARDFREARAIALSLLRRPLAAAEGASGPPSNML